MASVIGLDGVELVPYIIILDPQYHKYQEQHLITKHLLMVKIRMKLIQAFKYQELHTYSKLNHKIPEQFKLVQLIWVLIWTLNGIISILVINYIMTLLAKWQPRCIGIKHNIRPVQLKSLNLPSATNCFFQWEKNTQMICSMDIFIKSNSILVLELR